VIDFPPLHPNLLPKEEAGAGAKALFMDRQ